MVNDGGSPVRETIYHYDRARRLTKVEFDTDGDGQVEQSVSYAYDGSGPRTKLVLPDGKTIAYEYDVNGRLVRAIDWDGQSARYAWDLAGRLVGVERSNAFESYYRNDAGGRLRTLKHVYRGAVVAQFDYTVDARGNRTQVTETILQPDESTDVHTI